MIRLAATTEKLQAVLAGAIATTQPQAIVCYSDDNGTTYVGGSQRTALNSTADVDILAAPAASTVRDVDYLSIYNRDTASVTVTVKYDVSATDSVIITVTLLTLETLIYTHAGGWMVMTATGGIKTPGGTVTSVALTVPSEFSVAGSPITTSGTLAVTSVTQSANRVWAGPTSGSVASPAFRALVAADMPSGITGKNYVNNPGFQIDQRVNSATSRADDVYCLDRWYALTQTAAIQVTQQTNQEDGTPYNIRLTQNQAAAQRMGLAQIIESANCIALRGQAVAESLRVRISNSQAVRYAILEWTGTADTVTSDVVNDWTSGTYTASNFFLAANLTITAVGAVTPSANAWTTLTTLTGTLGSSVTNVIVMVWTEGTAAQNVTLDVARFKLELGANATPFVFPALQEEFAIALRYWRVIGKGINSGQYVQPGLAFSTTISRFGFSFEAPMRASPTGSVSAVGDFSIDTGAANPTVTSTSFTTSAGGFHVQMNVASGLTAATGVMMLTNNTSARIFLDAEL